MEKQWKRWQTFFFGGGGSKITEDGNFSLEEVMTNLESLLKYRDYSAKKVPSSQSFGFSSSHVWMWELDCEESWAPKK